MTLLCYCPIFLNEILFKLGTIIQKVSYYIVELCTFLNAPRARNSYNIQNKIKYPRFKISIYYLNINKNIKR